MPQQAQETQSVWVPLGGSSRRYRNRLTGETISRRQYDKLYGTLRRQGYSSYEAKAKAAKQQQPERAALRPARGRRSIRVVTTLQEFQNAWGALLRYRRQTVPVHVLIGSSPHWQRRLIGKVGRPDILVNIHVEFLGAIFHRAVITPYLRFLTVWGIQHYKRFLERRGKPGDRVGVWVGYEFETPGGRQEVITTPVREQPLGILSGEPFSIDEQIARHFAEMDSIKPVVRGVMLRILVRR